MAVNMTFPVRLRRSTDKKTCPHPMPISVARPSIVCAPFRLSSRSIFRSTDCELEGCVIMGFMVPLRNRKVRSSVADVQGLRKNYTYGRDAGSATILMNTDYTVTPRTRWCTKTVWWWRDLNTHTLSWLPVLPSLTLPTSYLIPCRILPVPPAPALLDEFLIEIHPIG